ncbi:methyltransferase domain-containing protein [Candidatus Woesearchaeota archaeon]|nr:methyltransferase domain-containing protein [Candidatus Woesearchaeota archaeon]
MKCKISDKEKIQVHYNQNAKEWIKDIDNEPTRYYFNELVKYLEEFDTQKKTLLDVGCGSGLISDFLTNYGFKKIHCLDYSSEMIKIVKKRARSKNNIEPVVGDVENLPYKDDKFDYVICVGLLECFQCLRKALKEIKRVTKPNGKILIRWTNHEGVWGNIEKLKKKLNKPTDPNFTKYYEMDYIKRLVKEPEYDFKIIHVSGSILFPFFILPSFLSQAFETAFINSKLTYFFEGKVFQPVSKSPSLIKNFYYAFYTLLEKK